jgi:Tol biopolymer transport system component
MVVTIAQNRAVRVMVVLILAVGFGFAVYNWLGGQRSPTVQDSLIADPTERTTMVSLPGTIVVTQKGSLYRLRNGKFTKIASDLWSQPALLPNHKHLVAVRRFSNFSDLYLLGVNGKVERKLTNNASSQVEHNHWSFYPFVSSDGTYVLYSYDEKYCDGCFLVDLSIFAQPINGSQGQARGWSNPNQGTGGDLQPILLDSGGLLYSKFAIDANTNQVTSQIWYQRGQGTHGAQLSPPGKSCQQPTLSPSGTEVAMICSAGGASTSDLVFAKLDLSQLTLGPPTVLTSGLPAAPAWSPDGKSLLYFSPQSGQKGPFQLYVIQVPSNGSKTVPRAVTSGDDFDSTSRPIWY